VNLLLPILSHTPIWVWVILAYLITRGVAAMRPGQTSLRRLAIVPLRSTDRYRTYLPTKMPVNPPDSSRYAALKLPLALSAGDTASATSNPYFTRNVTSSAWLSQTQEAVLPYLGNLNCIRDSRLHYEGAPVFPSYS